MGSNSGLTFIARTLGMDWELDCTYRPWSSGQIKRINRMLKETLTKLSLESREGGEHRPPSLSFALGLLHPTYKEGLPHYEIILERPLRLLPRLRGQQSTDSLTILFSGQGAPVLHKYYPLDYLKDPASLSPTPVSPCLNLVILSGSSR